MGPVPGGGVATRMSCPACRFSQDRGSIWPKKAHAAAAQTDKQPGSKASEPPVPAFSFRAEPVRQHVCSGIFVPAWSGLKNTLSASLLVVAQVGTDRAQAQR